VLLDTRLTFSLPGAYFSGLVRTRAPSGDRKQPGDWCLALFLRGLRV
jgi:hypothetical protein